MGDPALTSDELLAKIGQLAGLINQKKYSDVATYQMHNKYNRPAPPLTSYPMKKPFTKITNGSTYHPPIYPPPKFKNKSLSTTFQKPTIPSPTTGKEQVKTTVPTTSTPTTANPTPNPPKSNSIPNSSSASPSASYSYISPYSIKTSPSRKAISSSEYIRKGNKLIRKGKWGHPNLSRFSNHEERRRNEFYPRIDHLSSSSHALYSYLLFLTNRLSCGWIFS